MQYNTQLYIDLDQILFFEIVKCLPIRPFEDIHYKIYIVAGTMHSIPLFACE